MRQVREAQRTSHLCGSYRKWPNDSRSSPCTSGVFQCFSDHRGGKARFHCAPSAQQQQRETVLRLGKPPLKAARHLTYRVGTTTGSPRLGPCLPSLYHSWCGDASPSPSPLESHSNAVNPPPSRLCGASALSACPSTRFFRPQPPSRARQEKAPLPLAIDNGSSISSSTLKDHSAISFTLLTLARHQLRSLESFRRQNRLSDQLARHP